MLTWEEIKKMSDEEVAAANKKLITKFVLVRVVLPIVAVSAVIIALDHFDKKTPYAD